MNFSEDVLRLNPELAQLSQMDYRTPSDRLSITDGFDSQLERDFYAELIARGYAVQLHGWTFHLPGGVDYTPDFIAWRTSEHSREAFDPRLMIYEVKGHSKQKNARDSRTHFKIAAGLYPVCEFYWVTRDDAGRWIIKRAVPLSPAAGHPQGSRKDVSTAHALRHRRTRSSDVSAGTL